MPVAHDELVFADLDIRMCTYSAIFLVGEVVVILLVTKDTSPGHGVLMYMQHLHFANRY